MGGSVSILISRSRSLSTLNFNDSNTESCFAEIDDKGSKILVGSMYRPPNSDIKKFLTKYREITYAVKKNQRKLFNRNGSQFRFPEGK